MIKFEPKRLNDVNEKLKDKFPVPKDFALKDEAEAQDILDGLRNKSESFYEMPSSDFNLCYQMSGLCTEDEFFDLKRAFRNRMSTFLFDIGWIYFQKNANEKRAVELFSFACEWQESKKPDNFKETLIGKIGTETDNIYTKTIEYMRNEGLSFEDIVRKFDIVPDFIFLQQLYLTYFVNCGKEEFAKYEGKLTEFILNADLQYLRPAVHNYTKQLTWEEMPQSIKESMLQRLSEEKTGETLGIYSEILKYIRQEQFKKIIEDLTNKSPHKFKVYNDVIKKIEKTKTLGNGFFSIVTKKYCVIDNINWDDYAYAYAPELYKELVKEWENAEYSDDFWPCIDENEIPNAKDIVLGTETSDAIKLIFNSFDGLYARDLLMSSYD